MIRDSRPALLLRARGCESRLLDAQSDDLTLQRFHLALEVFAVGARFVAQIADGGEVQSGERDSHGDDRDRLLAELEGSRARRISIRAGDFFR